MASHIDLNGTWAIEGRGDQGLYPRMEGRVPGDVYTAAREAGVIRSSRKGRAMLENAWLQCRSWRYARGFTIAPDIAEDRYFLHIGKSAPGARLSINGRLWGDIGGLSRSADITNFVREGENAIALDMQGEAFLQDVHIDCFSMAYMDDIRLRWLEDGGLECLLRADVYEPGRYTLEYRLMRGGEQAFHVQHPVELKAGSNELRHVLTPENPLPWGKASAEPPVYECLIALDKLGVRAHRRILRTGNARWARDAQGFTLHGEKRFLRGVAWEAGFRSDKEEVLRYLAHCGINALRVMGLESDAFYAACDALNLAVWQELDAPAEPGAWAAVARRLRNHPSLCCMDPGALRFAHGKPADEGHPLAHAFMEELADVVQIPLLPASPGEGDLRETRDFLPPAVLERLLLEDGALLRSDLPFSALDADAESFAGDLSLYPLRQENPFWALRPSMPDIEAMQAAFGAVGSESDLPVLQRISRFWQGYSLRLLCEEMVQRQAETFGVFAGIVPAESAVYDASLFDGSRPRPALSMLRSAFADISPQARLHGLAFKPGDTIEADVFLLRGLDVIATVDCTLYDSHGGVVDSQSLSARAVPPVGRMGRYSFQLPSDAMGIYLLRLETQVDDQKYRSEYPLAVCRDGTLFPLRNPPMLHLEQMSSGEARYLSNPSDALALGLHLPDMETLLPAGWTCLLPREQAPLAPGAPERAIRPEALNPSL